MKKIYIIITSVVIIITFTVFLALFLQHGSYINWDTNEWKKEKNTNNALGVPKIIHQTWKTDDIPSHYKPLVESWKNKYPDYKYNLWSDQKLEEYVKKHWSWYLPVWEKLVPFIKKVDTVRYMWMYDLGGMYADLDMECLKKASFLEKYPGMAFIPSANHAVDWSYDADKASPAWLASVPKNPIWLYILRYIANNTHRPVLSSTGPIALANTLKEIKKEKNHNIVLVSEYILGIGSYKNFNLFNPNRYSNHLNFGTWDHPKVDPPRWSPPESVIKTLNQKISQAAL